MTDETRNPIGFIGMTSSEMDELDRLRQSLGQEALNRIQQQVFNDCSTRTALQPWNLAGAARCVAWRAAALMTTHPADTPRRERVLACCVDTGVGALPARAVG